MDPTKQLARWRRHEVARNDRWRRFRTEYARARTEPLSRVRLATVRDTREETATILAELGPIERPKTRADCERGERPCPFVSCAHHLYLDVSGVRTGSRAARNLKVNFPGVGPEDLERMPYTCALDLADEGGASLDQVGQAMNLTRERIRQIELVAMAKVRDALAQLTGQEGAGKRRLPVYAEVG